jgi:hypothetical protein
MFEKYFEDSRRMSRQSLVNISLSSGSYRLKDSIQNTKTNVLIIVCEKELNLVVKSGKLLEEYIPDSKLYVAKNMGHGEMSLVNYEQYLRVARRFIEGQELPE